MGRLVDVLSIDILYVDAFRKRDSMMHGGQETGEAKFAYDDVSSLFIYMYLQR